jgi:asparagine synthase (glutamine-hydrolysing)
MCGIGGYLDPGGALNGEQVLATLAAALAHRGPDGEGFLREGAIGLAHRRLAIIDLSEGGAQPMRVGPIVVVFNGEIYNYRELRQELQRYGVSFVGASDTEVLAQAYLHWGVSFVERLRGMWAFAIADLRTQELVCSRDPFGIKPFYYTHWRGAFLFASEPQALLRAGVSARANLPRAAEYLALGITDHTRETLFADIVQLGAGETLRVGPDAVARACEVGGTVATGGSSTAAEFAADLRESIRLHLRSDVPVGTCLSGGLDSSTVAALGAAEVRAAGGPRFTAITAASLDGRTDERRFAKQVVERCDLAWHVVTPTASEFALEIDACLRAQGEPALSPSVYFQYCVMRAARHAGLKVMLDGQGADELLGGYERYVPLWALEVARASGTTTAVREFVRVARRSRLGLRGMSALAGYILIPSLRRWFVRRRSGFLRAEFATAVQRLLGRMAASAHGLQDARNADLREFSLPALLRYEDRNSMAHGIEARVPYVDRQVAGCALRLPPIDLYCHGFSKYPLRELAAQLLPHTIAWRSAKVGFEPPTQRWLEPLAGTMKAEVECSTLLVRLCATMPSLQELPTSLRWRFYNLARWQQLFGVAVD